MLSNFFKPITKANKSASIRLFKKYVNMNDGQESYMDETFKYTNTMVYACHIYTGSNG